MIVRNTNIFKECCICFSEMEIFFINKNGSENDFEILSVNTIKKTLFDNDVIPNDILLESSCKKHYFCIECIRKIITNYESHPINSDNSVMYCPYPFEECVNDIGFRYIIEDRCIEELLTPDEYRDYINYTNQYLFPGFELVKCVGKKFDYMSQSFKECTAEILVSIDDIKKTPKGELIVNCDQNEECLKSFCYHCKEVTYLTRKCETCTFVNENQNPEAYNRYFNKSKLNEDSTLKATDDEDQFDTNKIEFPTDFLLKNKDVTVELAIEQLLEIIENPFSYMLCCICKTPMYKTEKCNALSHHKIERCYACGRIGDKYIGLGEHWSSTGVGGCPRFMYDSYIIYRLKQFICRENECYSHDMGECQVDDHQDGIKQYHDERIKSIILHSIQSLLPEIRYVVYDKLLEHLTEMDNNTMKFLPYKQTLKLLEKYPMRTCDYTEEIMYEQMGIDLPQVSVGDDKSKVIDDLQPSKQILPPYSSYTNYNNSTINTTYNPLGISAWRQNFERQRLLITPELNNLLNLEMDGTRVQLNYPTNDDQELDITEIQRPTIDELTVQLAELGINSINGNNSTTNSTTNTTTEPVSSQPVMNFPYHEIIQTYIDEFGDGSDHDNDEDSDSEVFPLLQSYTTNLDHSENTIDNDKQNENDEVADEENNGIQVLDDLLEIITLD